MESSRFVAPVGGRFRAALAGGPPGHAAPLSAAWLLLLDIEQRQYDIRLGHRRKGTLGPNDGVKHVILYSALQPGNLMLVECNDGSFRILRDEQPVAGCRWESHRVEAAAK